MLLPNPVGNHTNTEFPWYTASTDFRCSFFRDSYLINPEHRIVQRRKYSYYQPSLLTAALYLTADCAQLFDYIMSDDVLESEDNGQNMVYTKSG